MRFNRKREHRCAVTFHLPPGETWTCPERGLTWEVRITRITHAGEREEESGA